MKNIIYLVSFIIIAFIGCSGTVKSDSNHTQQDKISILRFDKDIYNYLQHPDTEKENNLKEKYTELLPAFGRIAMEHNDAATLFPALNDYFSNSMLLKIYKDALDTYKDVTSYEDQLSSVNNIIEDQLTGKKLPQLAMHVSGFRENVIIVDNLISICTDKYLGSEYQAYTEFFQPYERQQMQPEYIVRDYLRAWLMSDIIKAGSDSENLLTAMVNEGKVLYALSVLLPDSDVNDIIGYTSDQTKWCKDNEKNVWQTIVKQNYLYATDHMLITRLINDAPSTSVVSPQSPGRVGAWMGWQIVNQYAKNKGFLLEDILSMDAQTILKGAKYNP